MTIQWTQYHPPMAYLEAHLILDACEEGPTLHMAVEVEIHGSTEEVVEVREEVDHHEGTMGRSAADTHHEEDQEVA